MQYPHPTRPFISVAVCCLIGLVPSLISLSCTSSRSLQPHINNLSLAGYYPRAAQVLGDDINSYGTKNQLLYLLDKGFVFHLAGNYSDSIQAFAQSQRKIDQLYTHSISNWGTTWVLNDYSAPYRGEDFESVLVNIFQAINYFVLGDLNEALVEARDVDTKLSMINRQYKSDQKNVYREDAFARLLMGVFYEARGNKEDINDAFISYVKALEVYKKDYAVTYNVKTPNLLKENLLTTAAFMGQDQLQEFEKECPGTPLVSLDEKKQKAEVYLIQYNGYSPTKTQDWIPIPLPDGYIMSFAFPRYVPHQSAIAASRFIARNFSGQTIETETELGEDISKIALKNLENRKIRVLAKAVVRPVLKYALIKQGEQQIRRKNDDGAGVWFKYFGSLFNMVTERADLRCWQTLPGEIRIGRLLLEPGDYDFSVMNLDLTHEDLNEVKIGRITVKAGEKKILMIRTTG